MKIDFERPEGLAGLGSFVLYDQSVPPVEVARLGFYRWEVRSDTMCLASVAVDERYQGQGIGTKLVERFRRYVQRSTGYRFVYASVVSQASYSTIARAFGTPVYVSDGIRILGPHELGRFLPRAYRFSPQYGTYGTIEASGIDCIWKTSKRDRAATQWDEEMRQAGWK